MSGQYQEPVEGKFPDATQEILAAMKSLSDEELDYSSDSSNSETEPEQNYNFLINIVLIIRILSLQRNISLILI